MLSGCMVQPMLCPAGENIQLRGTYSLNKAENMVKSDMVFKTQHVSAMLCLGEEFKQLFETCH